MPECELDLPQRVAFYGEGRLTFFVVVHVFCRAVCLVQSERSCVSMLPAWQAWAGAEEYHNSEDVQIEQQTPACSLLPTLPRGRFLYVGNCAQDQPAQSPVLNMTDTSTDIDTLCYSVTLEV